MLQHMFWSLAHLAALTEPLYLDAHGGLPQYRPYQPQLFFPLRGAPPAVSPRRHGGDGMMAGAIDLFIKKRYAERLPDGGVVITPWGRERLARWEATMERAYKSIDENNARQRRASLERKIGRIAQELAHLNEERNRCPT